MGGGVGMVLMLGRAAARLRRTALVREGTRGRPLRVGAVKGVGRVEGAGRIVTLHGAVDSAGVGPGYHLHRAPQGGVGMC